MEPASTVKIESIATAVVADNRLGSGTLCIDEEILRWTSDDGSKKISLEYPQIYLHAISRDRENSQDCLYMQVGSSPDLKSFCASRPLSNDGDNPEEEEDDDDADEDETIEVLFEPQDKLLLDSIYKAMTECQRLHPDPADDLSEENEGDFDEEDEDEGQDDLNGNELANGSNGQAANASGTRDEPMDQ